MAGGVALAAASRSRDPIPYRELEPHHLFLPMLAASAIGVGAAGLLTVFLPRPGWDELDLEDLPPIRLQPSREGRIQIGLSLPTGSR